MIPNIEFVIFDCDGVLVDSEYLACQIGADLITKAGYEIDAQTLAEQYAGLIFLDILKDLEKRTSNPFSYNLVTQMHDSFTERMETELNAVNGIFELLNQCELPYCLCSNSTYQNIEDMLSLLGLFHFFEGRIFSAPDMGTKKPKPAPDIFLYAAEQFKISPEQCVVVEDSSHGVEAAHKAGMRVIGFTGARHTYPGHAERLSAAGAETVINHHKDLIPVIRALNLWKERF